MESRLIQGIAPGAWTRYGVAIGAALAGLLLRLPLAPLLEDKAPYLTFFLATAASATYGGFGPGLLTTLLGALLAAIFVILPVGSVSFIDPHDYFALGMYLVVGAIISHLAGRLLMARMQENALRILLEQTLGSIGDAVISTDDLKLVRMLNPVAEQLTGWTLAEAKGKPIDDIFRIVREGSDATVENPIEKVIRTGDNQRLANDTELIAKDGRRISIDDSVAPIRNEKGVIAGAVLIFRDISRRRQAERQLEGSERRCRNILESINDAFILLDHEWKYSYVNPSAEKIMQMPAASLIGQVHWDIFPATRGTLVEKQFRRAVTENAPVRFENHYETWDKWFDISAYPSEEGLSVYFHDITERKRSEATLRRLHEDLEHFTFASSHDLQEPLRMITIYAQMLERKLHGQLDEEARSYISRVVNGGLRVSRMIEGLLRFYRLGDGAQSLAVPVESEAALKEALYDLHILIQEKNAVITQGPLPVVMVNYEHLCQLFQNLLGNALKYTRSDVTPQIHITARESGGEWVFAVQDNGLGIAAEYHSQIFVPFKRLHSAEVSGTGIGLATCKRIVERYGGRIWVESQEGNGATFYFTLRAAVEGALVNG